MAERHVPFRTCIGCRRTAARGELVRFVLAHGSDGAPRVVRDDAAQLAGRGAWVHDDEQCKQQAVRKRALRRALRVTGDVELGFPELGEAHGHDGDGHVTSPN